jgi:hypothetical protein
MSWGVILAIILIVFIFLYTFNTLFQFRKNPTRKSVAHSPIISTNDSFQEPIDQQVKEGTDSLIFLFNQLPSIDEAKMAAEISKIEPIESQVSVDNLVERDASSQQPGLAFIKFDNHKLQLLSLNLPIPEGTLQNTVYPSGWSKSDQNAMRQHRAHILCSYKGDNSNPVERMIAMYKVASYFTGQGLLGVLDETAWNCVTSNLVNMMFEPSMLSSCRENIPLEFWTNLVKFSRPNGGVWLCTKGNYRFGVQDFAYLGTVEDIKETRELFTSLFHYVRQSGISFNAGETAQIGERLALRFSKPIEFQEYLESPLGTLVVQKIDLS